MKIIILFHDQNNNIAKCYLPQQLEGGYYALIINLNFRDKFT